MTGEDELILLGLGPDLDREQWLISTLAIEI